MQTKHADKNGKLKKNSIYSLGLLNISVFGVSTASVDLHYYSNSPTNIVQYRNISIRRRFFYKPYRMLLHSYKYFCLRWL